MQVIQNMQLLINQKRLSDAYQLALKYEQELEGDAQFDYLLGISAKAVKDWQRAVFAFERILLESPNNLNARYALGVTYFELNNLDAAQREFSRINALSVSPDLAASVDMYQQAIERRKALQEQHWSSWLKVKLGYDSNPNSGVDQEFIEIPRLGQVLLFEESQENASQLFTLEGKTEYFSPINQLSSWAASASIQHSSYSDSLAFDRTFLNFNLGYQTELANSVWQLGTYYRTLRLAGDAYLDIVGIDMGAHYPLDETSKLGANILLSQESYQDQPLLDKQTALFDAWFQKLSSWGVHKFFIRMGKDSADINSNDIASRKLMGAGYRWDYTISEEWLLNFDLDYLSADYEEINPIFLDERNETFIRGQLEVVYKLTTDWVALAELTIINNDSNLAIYEYQRNNAVIGVRYDF